LIPLLSLDSLIERAIALLAVHPLIKDPLVMNEAGQPYRITRMRDFDGFEINNTGATLSIFPYSYQGTSNETIVSNNAAMVFKTETLGSGDQSWDQCTLGLVVKLQIQGLTRNEEELQASPHRLVVQRSVAERLLYKWGPVMRQILLTFPLRNLQGLVRSSTVNWISFRTTKWDGGAGGKNAVFHEAVLLWQLHFNAPHQYRLYPARQELPNLGAVPTWTYLGVRSRDCVPMYWDDAAKVIVTINGEPIVTTPKGQKVVFDLENDRFETPEGVALSNTQLEDNSVTPAVTWIDRTRLLVGALLPSYDHLLWDTVQLRFEKCDGTAVTHLTDCNNIELDWDPDTKTVLDADTGNPLTRNDCFIPLKTSVVNIFDANSLELRDQFDI
jgi:hypothetical protein